jgi:hypothetical protein
VLEVKALQTPSFARGVGFLPKRRSSMSAWIDQIFEAQQVNSGNVVRRKIDDVNKYASMDELIEEVKRT